MSRRNWTDEKLFSRLENNKSDKAYWENVRELRSRANVSIFNKCVKLIKSPKPKQRTIAINVLSQLGPTPRPFFKQSRQLFFDILRKEKNKEVLLSVLAAIGHNNDNLPSTETAILTSFKSNKDENVRKALVFALLSVENKSAIDTLIHLTADKSSDIRNWATFGIGSQIEKDNKAIREALWQRVNDKHRETKLEAIAGLAKRKDSRIKEIIKKELLKGEPGALLVDAINDLNDKELVSSLYP